MAARMLAWCVLTIDMSSSGFGAGVVSLALQVLQRVGSGILQASLLPTLRSMRCACQRLRHSRWTRACVPVQSHGETRSSGLSEPRQIRHSSSSTGSSVTEVGDLGDDIVDLTSQPRPPCVSPSELGGRQGEPA